MPGRTDSRPRLLLLLAVFVVASASIVVRLAWWQIGQRDHLVELARQQIELRVEEPSLRGTIYDRTGVVALASTVTRHRLAASPDVLPKATRRAVAERLVALLGLEGDRAAQLTERMTSGKRYVILVRELGEEHAEAVRGGLADGSLAGLSLEPVQVRVYPQPGGGRDSTLAAHLLGFANREGVGQYGVEQRYQEVLGGVPRVVIAERDVAGRPVADTARIVDAGTAGADVRLTIDASLQLAVEQEVFATWVADQAASVSAVVLDPHTGEVLAHATYPSYDANDYAAIAEADPGRFIDPNVSAVYEPGSVFKMLTAAAALDAGVLTKKTRINDTGTLVLDRGQSHVDDADKRAMGWLTFEDVIAYSRNVGAAKAALMLGDTTVEASRALAETWARFGFGRPTGIDVSGEVGGIVNDPASWQQIDLANGSFGQGVAVTPMQLAVAYAAMVNGGVLVQPHVVQAIGADELTPELRGQVIDAKLSDTLVGLMEHVLTEVDFYRDRTLVDGYRVGGKTGTAQIWDAEKKRWKARLFNYSFIGFIGRDEPEFVVAVTIREARPTTHRQGQIELPVMSFELFRRIATDTMTTLDLPSLAPLAAPDP